MPQIESFDQNYILASAIHHDFSVCFYSKRNRE